MDDAIFLMRIRKYKIYTSAAVFLLILILIVFSSCRIRKAGRSSPWSVRMAESVMKRNPEPWMIDFREKPKWEYTQGLVLNSLMSVWRVTSDSAYLSYVREYYDQFVREDGSIWLYKLKDYNIDRINPGKVLFELLRITGEKKYEKAIFLLREQMKSHPRTEEGGFWHKKIYPHQMWLDGIYMASPFLAQYAVTYGESTLLEDVANQIMLMEKYARDEVTGLLYHGWDESRRQRWADPESGRSPHFWGRGMGWYAMALVDVLEIIPADHPRRAGILAVLNRLVEAIVSVQDASSGVWFQVVDQVGREGNYLESSASSMFVYAMLKAVRQGWIDDSYREVAQRGYEGILNTFIEVDASGEIHIHSACAVAGLGGEPYRDGSYDYYIHTEQRSNDPKAVGPFILASLEVESLKR